MNRFIIEYLLASGIDLREKTVLDIPCGDGEFLDSIKAFFPNAHTIGADIQSPTKFAHQIRQFDARDAIDFEIVEKVDLVTCISGVMEFDNTLSFLRSLRKMAGEDSIVIVTNDNLLTVRDRTLYFLFGRFGQYKTIPEKRGATWKILHLADLERISSDAGLKVKEVHYVVGNWTAWLWLPLALPLYGLQIVYFLLAEHSIKFSDKRRYFPFVSTIARHYLFICEKESNVDEADSGMVPGTK